MPGQAEHVWGHYLHLHEARGPGVVIGDKLFQHALSYSEIASYCAVADVPLSPWEVALIVRLDNVFRSDSMHPAEFEPESGVKSMMQSLKSRSGKGR